MHVPYHAGPADPSCTVARTGGAATRRRWAEKRLPFWPSPAPRRSQLALKSPQLAPKSPSLATLPPAPPSATRRRNQSLVPQFLQNSAHLPFT